VEQVEWKPGWGRHILIAIEEVVCKDCLVGFICEMSCHNYSMIHGTMISWFSRIKGYNVTEDEFKIKLDELVETWGN